MDETTAVVNEIEKHINNFPNIDKIDYFELLYKNGKLTDEVVGLLIKNDIGLDYLAHLPLNDSLLLSLFNRNRQLCAEAAFTLIDRTLKDEVTKQRFQEIFGQCCNESISKYLFGIVLLKCDIDGLLKSKILDAIQYIKQQYSINDEIYKTAVDFEVFFELRNTENIDFIKKYFQLNNYIYDIAISQNVNTPIDIINELCSIKEMKYSKVIRANAVKTKKKVSFLKY